MDNALENDQYISFKHIVKVTYPVVVSMFSLNLMVFVDRAFVAKYDLTQFAATMPAGNLATTIGSIFIGIIGFTSTLVAQYYGAKNSRDAVKSMWQGVYLSIAFYLLLLAVSTIASGVFGIMGHGGELLKYELQYFYLIIISGGFQLFATAFSSFYRGIGDTKTTMYVGILANAVNVLLDWMLIYGVGLPEMGGVAGSGLATVISCVASVIAYVLILNSKSIKAKYNVFADAAIDRTLIYKLVKFGLPSGIQTFVGTGYFSLLLIIIGKTGEFNLSCSNIAFTIEGISIFPIWGLGAALGIIAGQERGAGRIGNIPKVVKKGILLGLCYNLLILIVFNFFPDFLVSIFSSDDKEKFLMIKDYTIPLVRLTSVWIVFDSIQILIGNVLRSVGDTMFMMVVYLVMPFVFYIVLPYMLSTVMHLPLFWIWIELVVFTLFMFTVVSARFISGRWKKINII